MNSSMPYIAISTIALLILALLAFVTFRNRRPEKLTVLAVLAFALVLAGVLFGENQIIGYVLMGAGIVLALIDILRKSRGPVG